MTTTPEQACAELLAQPYLASHPDRDLIARLCRVAYLEGCTATLRADMVRLGTAPAVEFPIPTTPRSYDHHAAVITGTGNASERRELDALCRGLRPQP